MFAVKDLPSHWRILVLILQIGFLFVRDLEAAKEWSKFKVTAEDTEELTISCPNTMHIVIIHGEYGNRDHDCSDDFNQHNLALKCNYGKVCHFAKVDDGMKTSCPEGVKKYLNLHYYCMLGDNRLSLSLLTRDDEEYHFTCPLNTAVYIIDAKYSDDDNTCVIDAKEDVSFSCWKNECSFYNIIDYLLDTCPEVEKKLLIMYVCNVEEYLITSAFEGRPEVIECPHTFIIDVLYANYSTPRHDCPPNDVDIYIKKRCSSKQRCEIEHTTYSQFPSGCASDLTELLIAYKCVPQKQTKTFTVFEYGLVDLTCFHHRKIKIIHASFGKKKAGCGSEDAMEMLKMACGGKGRCCETANSKLLGNSTCPENSSQKLRVTYECIDDNSGRIHDEDMDECRLIRFKVSSSFGDITSETVQKMDDNLVLMIGSSLPRLLQMSLESYEGIIEYMKYIPGLEVVPGSEEKRNDSYYSSAEGLTDMITRTKSKYEAISWYTNFIQDRQIIDDADIDIEYLTDVMTETGVFVNSFESLLFGHMADAVGEVDISILRFPDIQNPYILVYHIRVVAWRISDRLLFYEKTKGGLLGSFQSLKFRPNKEYFASFTQEMIASATAEAESLFD